MHCTRGSGALDAEGAATFEMLPLPRALMDAIRTTLDTPQFGPYHNKRIINDTHD